MFYGTLILHDALVLLPNFHFRHKPKGVRKPHPVTLRILVPKGLSARTACFVLRRDYFVSLHRLKMKTILWWLVI